MARWHYNPYGSDAILANWKIGATVSAGQIACALLTNGEIGDPASVNDYSEALGTTTEAGTYSTTQGTGDSTAEVVVEVECDAMGRYLIKMSGGTAADTAWVDGTDGNILTTTAASGTVITDADVGTSEYVGGLALQLTGSSAGQSRVIQAHTDNTSETVVVPFDVNSAVGNTFLRVPGRLNQGIELTTNFEQINGRTGAGVDLPDTGHGLIWQIYVKDNGSKITPIHGHGFEKKALAVVPESTTNPEVYADLVLIDTVDKSLA